MREACHSPPGSKIKTCLIPGLASGTDAWQRSARRQSFMYRNEYEAGKVGLAPRVLISGLFDDDFFQQMMIFFNRCCKKASKKVGRKFFQFIPAPSQPPSLILSLREKRLGD